MGRRPIAIGTGGWFWAIHLLGLGFPNEKERQDWGFFVRHVDLGFTVINGNRTGMKMVDGCILFL